MNGRPGEVKRPGKAGARGDGGTFDNDGGGRPSDGAKGYQPLFDHRIRTNVDGKTGTRGVIEAPRLVDQAFALAFLMGSDLVRLETDLKT